MSAVARPAVETLVSVLKRRATEQPDRLAYVFVSEGAGEDRLTYGELDRKAKAIAHSLQGVAARGDCALLLYPAGLDFLAAFLGCLYAGVIAIPLFAPRPNREDPRLNAIIEDSGARLALTVSNALPDRSSRCLIRSSHRRAFCFCCCAVCGNFWCGDYSAVRSRGSQH